MTTTSRGERFEGLVQVLIMLVIGAMAGAASFTHVHDVAVAHGQPNWIGWADAVVVELMSIALGLELRRRARTHRPTGFVLASLVFFITVSLAAQVVEAERSIIGWLAAALPALGFLVLAKVVLSRTAARTTTTTPTPTTAAPATAAGNAPTDARPASITRPPTSPTAAPGLAEPITTADTPASAEEPTLAEETSTEDRAPAQLLTGARIVATAHHKATGTPITSDILAERMRLTPTVAQRLLNALNELQPSTAAPTPERTNGTTPALATTPAGATLW